MKNRMYRKQSKIFGFTLTEMLIVTAIITSIPTSKYVRVKKMAYQTQCNSNLRNISIALISFKMDYDDIMPKAEFYPKNIDGKKSIVTLLSDYLGGTNFKNHYDNSPWVCPGLPVKLRKKGLSFIYNDSIAGKRPRRPSETWVLIEMNAVSAKIPAPHPKGYNILFADGSIQTTKTLPKDISEKRKSEIKAIEEKFFELGLKKHGHLNPGI